jgi:hypothetical protein
MQEKHLRKHMAVRKKQYLYDRKLLHREHVRKAAEERIKRAEEARKSAEERAESAAKARESSASHETNGKGSGWLWKAILIIAAAAAIWWFFFRR